MMISVKSHREIELMRRAGRLAGEARALARNLTVPGVATQEIDRAIHEFIIAAGASPTFLHYNGFPGSVCISVNDEVIHGIPGPRVIREGDIVSLDIGATLDGYVGDCAATFAVGEVAAEARRLIAVTRQSFFEGVRFARVGCRVSDISAAVQRCVEQNGFSVVREYVGHGVGEKLHEPPEVPNFGKPGHGPRLVAGMTIAIEPMVNAGGAAVRILPDNWTVVTLDGSPSAHYENTVLITDGEPEILTMADDV